jgi:ABC-2 type transport system permease protein
MDKIFLIIQREFLVRVKKKSFWIATLLMPLLIAAVYAIPVFLMMNSEESKTVQVIDESGLFKNKLAGNKELKYQYDELALDDAKKALPKSKLAALTYIPKEIVNDPKSLKIFGEKTVSIGLQNDIERDVQSILRNYKLQQAGIDTKIVEENKVNVSASTYSLADGGAEKSSNGIVSMGVGFFLAFLLYMTSFVYGSQVMNGVIEEKNNRIVEVIISSVKPFQLLIGKVIGVGLAGLVQLILWITLTFLTSTVSTALLKGKIESKISAKITKDMSKEQIKTIEKEVKSDMPAAKIEEALSTLPIGTLLFSLIFFFIGGYMLYSSLFAAVGAAVDNIQDAQQFMMPITIPIIISFMLAQFVIQEPNGTIAFWASIIPFTSPINMVMRIPYGVETWELILSMVLLVLGFMGTTWLAGKIYRVGILMYGKKPSFKELGKWILYKG